MYYTTISTQLALCSAALVFLISTSPLITLPEKMALTKYDSAYPESWIGANCSTIWKSANTTAVFLDAQQTWRRQTAQIDRTQNSNVWRLDEGLSLMFGNAAGTNMSCGITQSKCGTGPGNCNDFKSLADCITSSVSLDHVSFISFSSIANHKDGGTQRDRKQADQLVLTEYRYSTICTTDSWMPNYKLVTVKIRCRIRSSSRPVIRT